MKRKTNSVRSIKWIHRNSLNNENCEEYVRNLCKVNFGFTQFDIKEFENYGTCLWITYGLYSYIIYISVDDVCLRLLEKKINSSNKDKYYDVDKIFFGDCCWYECLRWIKKRNIL